MSVQNVKMGIISMRCECLSHYGCVKCLSTAVNVMKSCQNRMKKDIQIWCVYVDSVQQKSIFFKQYSNAGI